MSETKRNDMGHASDSVDTLLFPEEQAPYCLLVEKVATSITNIFQNSLTDL